MKSFKKFIALAIVCTFTLVFVTGCGSSSSEDDKTIKVAASPTPHAELLEQVKDNLEEEGYTLEIIEFDDYVKPNQAVTDGDVDANFFQHQPYLDQYNEENGTDIVSAGAIHYEAMGVYKAQKSSFDELSEGDKIGVPNDVTNEARALQLLEANGVIKLKDGAGLNATKQDIVENPHGVEIVELEAAILPSSLPDLALAVINSNYALEADITDTVITKEASDSEAAETYANVIACANGEEDSDKIQALVKALQSDEIRDFLEKEYKGVIEAKF